MLLVSIPLSFLAMAMPTTTFLLPMTHSIQRNRYTLMRQHSTWKPSIDSLTERKRHFHQQRQKQSTATDSGQLETLQTIGFHHIEFYTGDASLTAKRFELALGMPITCWSSLATGNDICVTYGLESRGSEYGERELGEAVRFLITAPLSRRKKQTQHETIINHHNHTNSNTITKTNTGETRYSASTVQMTAPFPLPGYSSHDAHEFHAKHGLAVRAVGIQVQNATQAYRSAVERGAIGVLEPTVIPNYNDKLSEESCCIAEVQLYGDVVLRLVSFHKRTNQEKKQETHSDDPTLTYSIPFLPHLAPYPSKSTQVKKQTYGLTRIDHTVGNVPNLLDVQTYIQSFTNYHLFAEFTPQDVGTIDSGLNSVVLASDNEAVLLPLNEPTEGKRKSQIQTFLEQNEGPGLQHIAIKTDDIFETISKMRYAEEHYGGFELMLRPSKQYYQELPMRLGDRLTREQYQRVEELGILADADEEGVLLQIFTKPLGDRPTLFLEIIQRIGCMLEEESSIVGDESINSRAKSKERPGCGGFGQGNFRELFKAIENHEKTLKV